MNRNLIEKNENKTNALLLEAFLRSSFWGHVLLTTISCPTFALLVNKTVFYEILTKNKPNISKFLIV